jgi:hypothetical protein
MSFHKSSVNTPPSFTLVVLFLNELRLVEYHSRCRHYGHNGQSPIPLADRHWLLRDGFDGVHVMLLLCVC